MALGTNHVTLTTGAVFVPELWSDEVIFTYKSNLVMPQLVSVMNHKGKRGDTVHVPVPTRGNPSVKAAETQVTLIAATETEKTLSIDKHYEYSRLIEDIVSVQALPSLRKAYTEDAGYGMAKQVDTDLHAVGELFQAGTAGTNYATAVIGSDGSTAYVNASSNEAALTDIGIRQVIQTLDDNDVPQRDRFLVVPPSERNNLLGIDRFTEQSFTGEAASGNSIRNGRIGMIYGIPVFVSTNCVDDGGARIALMFQREAVTFIEQMGVRTQTQYKQEYLADLFTADMLYGTGTLRDDGGVAIAVAA